jgi:hypothetical protein
MLMLGTPAPTGGVPTRNPGQKLLLAGAFVAETEGFELHMLVLAPRRSSAFELM